MAKNKKIDPEESAFPTTAPFSPGIEVRAFIATQVLTGLLIRNANSPAKELAKLAVNHADELIDQLNKNK